MNKITKTYAIGDHMIHAERNDSHMTLCGQFLSDVKPFSPSAITCGDCRAVVDRLEANDMLATAFAGAGIRVERIA
jgi:hypothetical protein